MTQTLNFSGIFISATSDGSMHQTFTQRSIAARMRRVPGRINSPMHGSICVKADKPTRVWVSPRWLVQLTTEFQKYVATRPCKAFHTKKKMVRSTLSEIWSALLRRFFRFRSIWKNFKMMQFWKVFEENINDAHLVLKWSMHRKTKLHGTFRLHALRFPEAFMKSSKKMIFDFSTWPKL